MKKAIVILGVLAILAIMPSVLGQSCLININCSGDEPVCKNGINDGAYQNCGCSTSILEPQKKECRLAPGQIVDNYTCGNGICESSGGETSQKCSRDCTPPAPPAPKTFTWDCGYGEVYTQSTPFTSSPCIVTTPKPSGGVCGDNVCNNGETKYTCLRDCQNPPGPVCGDNMCENSEKNNCSADCGNHDSPVDDSSSGGSQQSYSLHCGNTIIMTTNPNRTCDDADAQAANNPKPNPKPSVGTNIQNFFNNLFGGTNSSQSSNDNSDSGQISCPNAKIKVLQKSGDTCKLKVQQKGTTNYQIIQGAGAACSIAPGVCAEGISIGANTAMIISGFAITSIGYGVYAYQKWYNFNWKWWDDGYLHKEYWRFINPTWPFGPPDMSKKDFSKKCTNAYNQGNKYIDWKTGKVFSFLETGNGQALMTIAKKGDLVNCKKISASEIENYIQQYALKALK